MIGIYSITNCVNNKQYIGSAVNIDNRFYMHKRELKLNMHCNGHLQNAWNKHGEDFFEFEILLFCDKENLLFYEQRAIDVFQVMNEVNGYNICPTAGNHLGYKHSEETKRKIGLRHKGKVISEAHRKILSEAQTGRLSPLKGIKLSEARIKKMIGARKGYKHSEETKAKISMASKNISQETRRRISETSRGRKHSLASKEKISKANKGHPVSEKTRQKIAEANRKRVWSVESRRKMSESLKKRKKN